MQKIKTKKVFEIVFISAVLYSFLLWAYYLFKGGIESSQFDIFFLNCKNFIADNSNVVGYSSLLDPYHNTVFGLQEKAYPPLTYVILYIFSKIVDADSFIVPQAGYVNMATDFKYLTIYMIFMAIIMIMLYTLIQVTKKGKMSVKIMTGFALCFSAPMLYSIERGNTIIFTVFLCMFFLFYYDSENKILKELALIALAIAAAFKITPALLGILLLYNKSFKEAIRTAIYGIIMVFGPFLLLKGGFSNIPVMFENIQLNLKQYSSLEGCTFTASVYKYGNLLNSNFTMSESFINKMMTITKILSFMLLIAVPFFKTHWEKVAAVVVVLVILPSHSGRYCILYMLPVIVMFLNEEKRRYIDFIYLICMIMISWVYVSKTSDMYNYSFALPIITFTLIITGIINIIDTFKNKWIKQKKSLAS